MEFFSNHLSFFFFLLITLLSSCQIHARDTQFFNKIPNKNNNVHIEKETKVVITPNKNQEPNFMPKNENSYGVYSHEYSSQLPPSTPTTNLIPNNKYLPKNYNPVAYVTIPQDNTDDDNNNNNNNNHRYNSGSSDDYYYRGDNTYDNNDNNNNNNEYYISGNTYDHYYRGDNTYDNNDNNNNNNQYYNNRAGSKVMTSSIEPSLNGDNREYFYINNDQVQDMSEPRFMDKGYTSITTNPTNTNNYSYKNGGKHYYYNNQEQSLNTKKYVQNPYENSREFANSYIANNELSNYNYNNFVNYENEEELQDEEHMP